MGVFVFHSTEAVWEWIVREEWLGVSMLHRPCSVYPGQHQCGLNYIIFGFYDIKIYMYYVFLKSIYICILYKRTQVVSDLILARWGSENVFDRPWVFKGKSKPQTVLWTFYINFVITVPFALFYLWDVLLNSSSTHIYFSIFILNTAISLVSSLSFWLLTLVYVNPLQVGAVLITFVVD